MNVQNDIQFERRDGFQGNALTPGAFASGIPPRPNVVNRTHRVVRQRANVMRARRSYVRSLLFPMILCSALLLMTGVAVWTGLYQESGAADAVQDISASLANSDNEFMVMLFWFVPVSLAVLGTVWFTRFRGGPEGETGR